MLAALHAASRLCTGESPRQCGVPPRIEEPRVDTLAHPGYGEIVRNEGYDPDADRLVAGWRGDIRRLREAS